MEVLQQYLKPLFSKPSTKITQSGRPSLYETPPGGFRGNFKQLQQPAWKQAGPQIVTCFEWAVWTSDVRVIASIIPKHIAEI